MFLEASSLQVWFEEFLSTPIANLIIVALGTLIAVLTALFKIKNCINLVISSNTKVNNSNIELTSQITKLEASREDLNKSREELDKAEKKLLKYENDIKLIKQALVLISMSTPQIVSSGNAKVISKILKEEETAKVESGDSDEESKA